MRTYPVEKNICPVGLKFPKRWKTCPECGVDREDVFMFGDCRNELDPRYFSGQRWVVRYKRWEISRFVQKGSFD